MKQIYTQPDYSKWSEEHQWETDDGEAGVVVHKTAVESMLESLDNDLETGGFLFGRYNGTKIEIVEATPPPPDSVHSEFWFECGVEGIDEKREYCWPETFYIGYWHTHPNFSSTPSSLDMEAFKRISSEQRDEYGTAAMAFLIVGSSMSDMKDVSCTAFLGSLTIV